jgi:hypothetical protein
VADEKSLETLMYSGSCGSSRARKVCSCLDMLCKDVTHEDAGVNKLGIASYDSQLAP